MLIPFLLPRSQRSAPKLCRPASIQLPEGTGKIAGILEAALGGDGGHLQGGAAQQLGGALQALAAQVLVGRGADHIMEAPQALAGADGRNGACVCCRAILCGRLAGR